MIREIFKRRLAQTGFVAALGALGFHFAALPAAAENADRAATHTALEARTEQAGGRAIATYVATVLDEDGKPATGAVTLMERGRALAGAALDAAGKAEIRFDSLTAGRHSLIAIYNGDATHAGSQSVSLVIHPEAAAVSDFSLGIAVPGSSNPTTMTIATPGEAGSLVATVSPAGGFTGFIALSCSGPAATTGSPGGTSLPVGVTCSFTPENLQITSAAAVSAQMVLQTTSGQVTVADRGAQNRHDGSKLALAMLLPGILGLGILGRKRRLFSRVALLALVGVVGVLGTTSCAARYRYLNHGPTFTGTQPGTYTLTITAQTSNGVTASAQSQTLTLVVQ